MPGQIDVLSMLRTIRPQRSRFAMIRLESLGSGACVLSDDLSGISDVLSNRVGVAVSPGLAFSPRRTIRT